MRDLARFAQLGILAAVLFVLLLAAWGVAVYRSPLAWFGAATLAFLFLYLVALVTVDARQDAELREAQRRREMTAAGYILIEEELDPRWTRFLWWEWATPRYQRRWVAVTDPAEEPPSRAWQPAFGRARSWLEQDEPAPAEEDQEAERDRLRALLQYIMERQRAGRLWYEQRAGRKAFPGTWDDDLYSLQEAGFIQGRSTGHEGRLTFRETETALAAFDGQEEEE